MSERPKWSVTVDEAVAGALVQKEAIKKMRRHQLALLDTITKRPNGTAARRFVRKPYPERAATIPTDGGVTGDLVRITRSLAQQGGYPIAPHPTAAEIRLVAMESGVTDHGENLLIAEIQWEDAGSPVWMLSADLVELLSQTEPPLSLITRAVLDDQLKLPFAGLCLTLPVGLKIPHSKGVMEVEALLLAETSVLSKDASCQVEAAEKTGAYGDAWLHTQTLEWDPAVVVVAVCKPRHPNESIGAAYTISPDTHLSELDMDAADITEVRNFALNFLLALKGGYTTHTTCRPGKRRDRGRRPGPERKLTKPYTLVGLTTPKTLNSTAANPGIADRTVRAHWVRGHWHAYWGKDAGERMILDSRELEDGTVLFKYLRWIKPYLTGVDQAPQPRYRSKE